VGTYGLASARVPIAEHKEEDIAQMLQDKNIAAHLFASLRFPQRRRQTQRSRAVPTPLLMLEVQSSGIPGYAIP
jgi:hypothetical protein